MALAIAAVGGGIAGFIGSIVFKKFDEGVEAVD